MIEHSEWSLLVSNECSWLQARHFIDATCSSAITTPNHDAHDNTALIPTSQGNDTTELYSVVSTLVLVLKLSQRKLGPGKSTAASTILACVTIRSTFQTTSVLILSIQSSTRVVTIAIKLNHFREHQNVCRYQEGTLKCLWLVSI